MTASDLSTVVVASTPPREQHCHISLEKSNQALKTFTGHWSIICMCLYNLTTLFQVMHFSSEGNFFNFSSREFSLTDISNLQKKKRCSSFRNMFRGLLRVFCVPPVEVLGVGDV